MKYQENFLGKEELKEMFSFEGRATRSMIMWVLSVIYLCNILVQKLGVQWLSYVVNLLLFYPALAVIQKRSRDAGQRGTFFLVCYSICLIMSCAEHFGKIPPDILLRQYAGHILGFFYLLLLVLCVLPSKPEADLNLRSPLLKYPLVYTAICWALAIAATIGVNYLTVIL